MGEATEKKEKCIREYTLDQSLWGVKEVEFCRESYWTSMSSQKKKGLSQSHGLTIQRQGGASIYSPSLDQSLDIEKGMSILCEVVLLSSQQSPERNSNASHHPPTLPAAEGVSVSVLKGYSD